ncbi:MAG: CHAP domain-containing protein [Eubacterium sp.]|nr:CHAP domain-containing protein [Eubacterium sp.]
MKTFTKKAIAIILSVIIFMTPVSMTASAVTTSQMQNTVLSIASNEIGYTGNGYYTKYGEWYGWQGAWCTTFVLWCFHKAGEKLGVKMYSVIIPSGGNCNSMISWFQNRGEYHSRASGYSPKKGDLIFFDWSHNGSAQHVGIVNYTSGGTVYTIEGNNRKMVRACSYSMSSASVMGYGRPNWESLSNGKAAPVQTTKATTQQQKTKQAATKSSKRKSKKKKTTTQAQTPQEQTTTSSSDDTSTTEESTTKKKPKKTTTTTKRIIAKDMKLHASTTDLEVGDSVNLDYTIEPKGAQAVVGYFCDEENIIEISEAGVITATGEGKATVVVCANDEIYKQCDFTVTEASVNVTQHTPDSVELETTEPLSEKTVMQKLNDVGINADKLIDHSKYFIYPAAIIGTTAVLAGIIGIVKTIASAIRKKKDTKESE